MSDFIFTDFRLNKFINLSIDLQSSVQMVEVAQNKIKHLISSIPRPENEFLNDRGGPVIISLK